MSNIIELEPISKEEQEKILIQIMAALTHVVREHSIQPEVVWEKAETQMVMRIPIPRLKHTNVTEVRGA